MKTSLVLSSAGFSSTSLDTYMNYIKKIPVLTAQEEQTLAEQYYYHKNLTAAKKLILSNLRFVAYIAQTYAGYGLALGDLIQEGSIGLMKAVKRFNPTMKVRLISFAVHWIKAEMQEFILRNRRMVKMATTKAKRKLFFNLRKNKKRLGWSTHEEVTAIAQDLGVKPETVREMESHLSTQDISLESNLEERQSDESPAGALPVMSFADSRYDPARLLEGSDYTEFRSNALKKAMDSLDEDSKYIITERRLKSPKTKLKQLALEYNLTPERIRQIEEKAIKKLRYQLAAYV